MQPAGGKSKPGRQPGKSTDEIDEVTVQEIQDVLADEGYSGDLRKARLKNILTELATQDLRHASRDTKKLVRTVKRIIRKYQAGKPFADDVL